MIGPIVGQTTKSLTAFVTKLFSMLEDQHNEDLISWSAQGDSFTVWNAADFSRIVLPQYFKHNNWQSFIRQLNMYGFHKVNDVLHSPSSPPGGTSAQIWEFKHPEFQQGAPDLLHLVRRKSARQSAQTQSSASTSTTTSTVKKEISNPPPNPAGMQSSMPSHPSESYHSTTMSVDLVNVSSEDAARYSPRRRVMSAQPSVFSSTPNMPIAARETENRMESLSARISHLEDTLRYVWEGYGTIHRQTAEGREFAARHQTALERMCHILERLTSGSWEESVSPQQAVINLRQDLSRLRQDLTSEHLSPPPPFFMPRTAGIAPASGMKEPYRSSTRYENSGYPSEWRSSEPVPKSQTVYDVADRSSLPTSASRFSPGLAPSSSFSFVSTSRPPPSGSPSSQQALPIPNRSSFAAGGTQSRSSSSSISSTGSGVLHGIANEPSHTIASQSHYTLPRGSQQLTVTGPQSGPSVSPPTQSISWIYQTKPSATESEPTSHRVVEHHIHPRSSSLRQNLPQTSLSSHSLRKISALLNPVEITQHASSSDERLSESPSQPIVASEAEGAVVVEPSTSTTPMDEDED